MEFSERCEIVTATQSDPVIVLPLPAYYYFLEIEEEVKWLRRKLEELELQPSPDFPS
jgi:hypothetical protein